MYLDLEPRCLNFVTVTIISEVPGTRINVSRGPKKPFQKQTYHEMKNSYLMLLIFVPWSPWAAPIYFPKCFPNICSNIFLNSFQIFSIFSKYVPNSFQIFSKYFPNNFQTVFQILSKYFPHMFQICPKTFYKSNNDVCMMIL